MRAAGREAAVALAGLAFAALAAVLLAPRQRPAERPEGEVILGQYGYVFGLSARTSARVRIRKTFKDQGRVIETFFVFPLFIDPDTASVIPDYSYAPLGAARLEASSNAYYPALPRAQLIEAMKEAVAYDLREKRQRHEITEVRGASLPGFRVETLGPQRVTTTYLVGERAHYVIVGEKTSLVVQEIIGTLRETQ